jgi:hypothetical protein
MIVLRKKKKKTEDAFSNRRARYKFRTPMTYDEESGLHYN